MSKINIILLEPEIAVNTGNIARSCVGFDVSLHLIRPYGFFLNNKKLLRSAVNYWDNLDYHEYDSFDEFIIKNNNPEIFIYTRHGTKSPEEINYLKYKKIYIMFGKESSGVPKEILKIYINNLIRIPTTSNVRSLNLSNTAAISIYEVVKQLKYIGLEKNETIKKDFIK